MHVASAILTDGHFIENANLKTQEYLDKICHLTTENKMQLNKKKSKATQKCRAPAPNLQIKNALESQYVNILIRILSGNIKIVLAEEEKHPALAFGEKT